MRRLDLSAPVDQPLTDPEQKEMARHLAFLKRFKSDLRLSLNAAEDLLINGTRPPTERGVCRHLLAKVDRACVAKALTRGVLKDDPSRRAAFLAGIVRIDPDLPILLEYLDTLPSAGDRRQAAAAFSITVDRLDFAAFSGAQTAKLLGVVEHTFTGYDRDQALLGLLSNEGFRAAVGRLGAGVPDGIADSLRDLSEVHRVAFRGERPADDEEGSTTDVLARALERVLSAPAPVLKSYPIDVRARLAELVLTGRAEGDEVRRGTRVLLDSLPDDAPRYTELKIARVEQLLRAGEEAAGRKLLNELASSQPDLSWATRRAKALRWPQVGRVTVRPGDEASPETLRWGFWLDGAAFAWIRIVPAEQAGAAVAEARLQAEMIVPGVASVLAHGMAKNGTVFVALPPNGKPFATAGPPRSASSALALALEGVQLLAALARAGVELPDLDEDRLLCLPGDPPRPIVAGFAGARRQDPSAAEIAHAPIARAWCQSVFAGDDGGLRDDLPLRVAAKLRVKSPLPVLAETLTRALARAAG